MSATALGVTATARRRSRPPAARIRGRATATTDVRSRVPAPSRVGVGMSTAAEVRVGMPAAANVRRRVAATAAIRSRTPAARARIRAEAAAAGPARTRVVVRHRRAAARMPTSVHRGMAATSTRGTIRSILQPNVRRGSRPTVTLGTNMRRGRARPTATVHLMRRPTPRTTAPRCNNSMT
jgi:hypothetical protein